MVARESLEDAKTALSAIGYEERIQFRPGFEVAHGHTLDLVRAVGRKSVHVEVHWRVSDDPSRGGDLPRLALGGRRAGVEEFPAPRTRRCRTSCSSARCI